MSTTLKREGQTYYRGSHALSTEEIDKLIMLGEDIDQKNKKKNELKDFCTQFNEGVEKIFHLAVGDEKENLSNKKSSLRNDLERLGFVFTNFKEENKGIHMSYVSSFNLLF